MDKELRITDKQKICKLLNEKKENKKLFDLKFWFEYLVLLFVYLFLMEKFNEFLKYFWIWERKI